MYFGGGKGDAGWGGGLFSPFFVGSVDETQPIEEGVLECLSNQKYTYQFIFILPNPHSHTKGLICPFPTRFVGMTIPTMFVERILDSRFDKIYKIGG